MVKLVDIEIRKAKKLTNELNKSNKKIEFIPIHTNAMNSDELIELFDDVEVVINAASPVYNVPIMKACIKSNCHYIDLGSDPYKYEGLEGQTSIDDQLPFDEKFKKKHLLALTNAGASPGFSDFLCKFASDIYDFDVVENVSIYFSEIIESDVFISSWSPYILLLETLLPATIYRNNEIITMASAERKKNILLPDPFGLTEITLFNGHPELRTIPHFLNIPVDYVEVGGSIMLNDMMLDDIILECLRKKVCRDVMVKEDIFEQLSFSFEPTDSFVDLYAAGKIMKEKLSCYTEITGRNREKRIRYNASTEIDIGQINKLTPCATATSYMVSIVPTLMTKKILEDEINQYGVLAPAALEIASDIIQLSKEFKINFNEESRFLSA